MTRTVTKKSELTKKYRRCVSKVVAAGLIGVGYDKNPRNEEILALKAPPLMKKINTTQLVRHN